MNYTLKKPKEFQASEKSIEVDFDGITTDCANLLRSGMTNNTTVLVGYEKLWHEVSVSSLLVTKQEGPEKFTYHKLETSNLQDFKKHIQTHKISLIRLGIIKQEKPNVNYMDYFSVAKMHPEFTYLEIEKLHKYIISQKFPSSKQDLIATIKSMLVRGQSVNKYIADTEMQKHEIINSNINMKTVLSPEQLAQRKVTRVNELNSLGMEFDEFEGNFHGFGFVVTADSLEEDTEEEWKAFYLKIRNASFKVSGENQGYSVTEPVETAELIEPETPNGLITLDSIGNFKPEQISELQGLSEKQDAIVKANPFVKITDDKTLKKAKAAKAALLKASTDTEKIETNASKYLNTFKAMIKKIVEPAAKKTRDAHKLQADEITAYENAEELRIQAENRAKLEKIKARTTRLFSVPFVFNGSLYQIGTLYVTPSQVETSTDDEFNVLVKQGEAIKQALDAAAQAESEKDKLIAELKKQQEELVAKLKALSNPAPASAPVEPATVSEPNEPVIPEAVIEKTAPIEPAPVNNQPVAPVTKSERVPFTFTPGSEYELPAPGNIILNAFDMAHSQHVQANPIPVGYIKSRDWLKHGTRLLADEILAIMANPDPSVKKAPRIVELCTIILNDV